MGDYNPPRGATYNFGGDRWKLSRTRLDQFMECQRCFWIESVEGVKKPESFAFRLHNALDKLFKSESDLIRQGGIFEGVSVIEGILKEAGGLHPAIHPKMKTWQNSFHGVSYNHPTGVTVHGGIDDLWASGDPSNPSEYFVVDYKGTARDKPVTNPQSLLYDSYRRQMDIYLYLLKKNGLNMSNTTYFVYAIGRDWEPTFGNALKFDTIWLTYQADDSWVENSINEALACLKRSPNDVPASGPDCHMCRYRAAMAKIAKR